MCLAEHPDPKQQHYLNLYKMGEGPLYSFFIPYHLVHFEVPNAIARVVLFRDSVAKPLGGPVVEVCAVAKRDLKAGEMLDDYGMYMTYGEAVNADEMSDRRYLPEGLVEGCKLKRDIAKDAVLTYDDVELPPNRLADQLRAEQYRHFRGETWLEERSRVAAKPAAQGVKDPSTPEKTIMKVVLFCGGRACGIRERRRSAQADGAHRLPAHPVARDEVLRPLRAQGLHPLPGYRADAIKNYFLKYNECASNDFVLSRGGKNLKLLTAISTTGASRSSTPASPPTSAAAEGRGEVSRGRRDIPGQLQRWPFGCAAAAVIESFQEQRECRLLCECQAAGQLSSYHDGVRWRRDQHRAHWKSGARINGGFMVLRQEIFSYMKDGEELVEEPFQRLIGEGRLMAYPHDGYLGLHGHLQGKAGP